MTTPLTDYSYDDLPALMSVMTGDEKHESAATSTMDVLWVLYDRILNITPGRVEDPTRDRFLLSKGHGPNAYYAVLAAQGFLDPGELARWTEFDSPLGGHPDRMLIPGVEISSGSLGHGLPLALGTALGLRTTSPSSRVVVLVGDAEFDEGSNHEAVQMAGRFGLGNLTCVAVDNSSAIYGWPGGLAARFTGEGWAAHTVDGRDHTALTNALLDTDTERPLVVVATVDQEEH